MRNLLMWFAIAVIGLITIIALTNCIQHKPDEPVYCMNRQTLETFEATRKYDPAGQAYIEYTDRLGFRQTLTNQNAKDWVCLPKEKNNA